MDDEELEEVEDEEEFDEEMLDEIEEDEEEPDLEMEMHDEIYKNKITNSILKDEGITIAPHKIIRIIPDDQRITSEIIQLPEMVEAIGIRCSEIENGSPIFTDYEGLSNPIDIATKEFYDRKSPLKITRQINYEEIGKTPTTIIITVEEFKVREMTFPIIDREAFKQQLKKPDIPDVEEPIKPKKKTATKKESKTTKSKTTKK